MTRHAESEVLSAYLDGELERAAAVSVETHLGECPDCAARLEGLQETVASLRRLERPPLPEAVTRGLRQRLQRERERPRRTAWLDALLPWRSLQPGMAAAVLVSGALLFLAYAGYVQRERAAQPAIFSAESREVPETAPAPPAGPESPPAEKPSPIAAPAPTPPLAARRPPPASPPAAKSESTRAAGDRDAVAASEEEAVADAVSAAAAGAATADTAAAPEPPAERTRREARTAPAELKAAGEIGGAGAAAPAAAQAAPTATADQPVALGPGIEKPVKIAGEELEFARLREARWPAVVILEAVITRQGRMEDVRFVEPQDLDPRIAAELRRTLQTWRYRPATRDGQPVAVRMTVKAHIRLQ